MKNLNFIPSVILAVIFSATVFSANAQSTVKTKKSTATSQSVARINAEILALETELANLEFVAKQNNVDLGKSWDYMMLDRTATVAVAEEKITAKN